MSEQNSLTILDLNIRHLGGRATRSAAASMPSSTTHSTARFPEGAGGIGRGTTQGGRVKLSAQCFKIQTTGGPRLGGISKASLSAPPSTTRSVSLKMKDADGAPSWWPGSESAVTYKKKMLTTFRVADFNPSTVQHFPHNDYARTPTLGQPYENWPYRNTNWTVRRFPRSPRSGLPP